MDAVDFIEMKHGTREEYQFLGAEEDKHCEGTAQRLLGHLKSLDDSMGGYKITRLGHSLQTATRAYRDGAEEEMVVAALLHDIGDMLSPRNHSEFAAAILEPFVSERTHWVVKYHGLFQTYYYAHHMDGDRHARDRFKDHPYYQDCVDFCEKWDQAAFDPDYENMSLEEFAPMVERIFARKPYALRD